MAAGLAITSARLQNQNTQRNTAAKSELGLPPQPPHGEKTMQRMATYNSKKSNESTTSAQGANA